MSRIIMVRDGSGRKSEMDRWKDFRGIKQAREYAEGNKHAVIYDKDLKKVRKTRPQQQAGFLNMPKMKMPQFGRW